MKGLCDTTDSVDVSADKNTEVLSSADLIMKDESADITSVIESGGQQHPGIIESGQPKHQAASVLRTIIAIVLLFLNYFLAQYDKFVLSYFQAEVVESLSLTSTQYGILSGYATGILFALFALPVAFVADHTNARVWVLTLAALWWSLCVLFQGLSHNFWQILLARIGMGIGQAPVEALSISLISDLVPMEWLFVCER
jgi:Na+/melibiose symporter-like transporter